MPTTPKRTLIRQAIVDSLEPLKTEGITEVYANRIEQYSASELPVVSCFFTSEEATPSTVRADIYRRTLNLRVETIVQGNSGLDDSLDVYQSRIESLLKDSSLGGHAQGIRYLGSETELFGESLESSAAKLTMNFEITFTE